MQPGIWLSLKEGNPAICDSADELASSRYLREISRHRNTAILEHVCMESEKSTEAKNRTVGARGLGWRMEKCSMGEQSITWADDWVLRSIVRHGGKWKFKHLWAQGTTKRILRRRGLSIEQHLTHTSISIFWMDDEDKNEFLQRKNSAKYDCLLLSNLCEFLISTSKF